MSPESVHARKRHGWGLWLTQSDARYPCGHRHRAAFLCCRLLPYLSLPAEKKILCFSTSVLDMISSFDFRHTKKPPHGITNGRGISLLSKIAMLCNGFEIQNPCCIHQPKKTAYFRRRSVSFHWLTSNRLAYVIFNLQISQSCRELKNSLTGISEYHSGDMAVKISRKLFSMPCGQGFYSHVLKTGQDTVCRDTLIYEDIRGLSNC